ncbi:MAG: hypothetical protein LBR70_01430 [Lactobacillaceae bacterium]|nr:hypothetical protein [Lactobacillaceae bacterium]
MIKKIIKNLSIFIFLGIVFASLNAFAQNTPQTGEKKIDFTEDGVYAKNIAIKDLQNLFDLFEYDRYIYMPGWKYPPIFLENMPTDFMSVEDRNKRINYFIKIMIPLALKTNEEIQIERLDFVNIRQAFDKNTDLTDEEKEKLEKFAERYDVFTRMSGLRRYNILIEKLDEKINTIPPSILIANAAIETNWGDSAPLREGNSLYKELVWYTDEGIKPEDSVDDSYRIKTFPTLLDSIRSFALKINSNVNYELFRHSRADLLSRGPVVNGRNISHNFYYNSNLQNFLGLLNYTITFYELTNIDKAKLGFPDENDFRLPD